MFDARLKRFCLFSRGRQPSLSHPLRSREILYRIVDYYCKRYDLYPTRARARVCVWPHRTVRNGFRNIKCRQRKMCTGGEREREREEQDATLSLSIFIW